MTQQVVVGQACRARLTPSRAPFKREVEVPTQTVQPLPTTSLFVLLGTALYSLCALSTLYSSSYPYTPLCCPYTPLLPLSLFSGTSLYLKLPVQPCKPLCYFTQLSLYLCLKNRGKPLLVLIVLTVLLGPLSPQRVHPCHPSTPSSFFGTVSLFLFFLLQASLLLLSLSFVWITLQERELRRHQHQKW